MQALRLDDDYGSEVNAAIKQYFIGPSFAEGHFCYDALEVFKKCITCDYAQQILRWWLSLSTNNCSPYKSQLNINAVAPFAQDIGLVSCLGNQAGQIRLAGSQVEDLLGQFITGMKISNVFPKSNELCKLAWQAQVEEQRLRYYTRDLGHVGKPHKTVGILELPLREENSRGCAYILSHIRLIDA